MQTLVEKIADLTNRHNKEVKQTEIEYRLKEKYPFLAGARFFFCNLYKIDIWATLDVKELDEVYSTLEKLKQFETLSMCLIRDGNLVVKQRSFYDELPDSKAMQVEKTDILPVCFDVDSFRSRIEIYLKIDEFNFRFNFESKHLFSVFFRRDLRFKGSRCIDASLVNNRFVMRNQQDESLGTASQVRFWSTDLESSHYVIYFNDDTDEKFSLESLIYTLKMDNENAH